MEILEIDRGISATGSAVCPSATSRVTLSQHPCEICKCCSCARVCMKCKHNCQPRDDSFIPVIACPDFEDMHLAPRIRYLYRSDYTRLYKLHLPGSR